MWFPNAESQNFRNVLASVRVCVCVYLVTVVDSGGDLSEDAPCLRFWQPPPLLDVVVQLSPAGVLHHDHDLIAALEHCNRTQNMLMLYKRHHSAAQEIVAWTFPVSRA